MSSRKLLILDLNGTLLLRSKSARPETGIRRRLRSVHPRPFLSSFREYIFHPSTMAWLDTMVWSSAQPHSVKDMVDHCFRAADQDKFLAIWARDTLGLSAAQYNHKTQTTKDLATPWTAFPMHSARTTLLLDDSARKAHRHPHNHVCVREYVQEIRNRDLAVHEAKRELGASVKQAKKGVKEKSKKLTLTKTPARGAPDVHPPAPVPAWVLSSNRYDETLLAVIGILEALKPQPDVCDWIRRGGLLPVDSSALEQQQGPDADDIVELASQLAGLSVATFPHQYPGQEQAQNLQWFDSEPVVSHWVGRGLHALAALQIEVDAGVFGRP